MGLEPLFRLDWKDSNSHLEIERASFAIDMRTWYLRQIIACLPSCSFAHACEGRSLQAGTPEIAIATYARSCGIGRRHGLPWVRLIPRVGMLTTTGPLGTAQARQPTVFGLVVHSLKSVIAHWELLFNSSHALCFIRLIYFRCMAGLGTRRAGFRWVPGAQTHKYQAM
uniref:Uncharacterized protein n=1 Tax=Ananas comosus var. bracteatus TaxID=296719 RepID=A0A6V7NH84_ANACO|nr:unnamed protein product [Ananas comosus var. bracteatus]